MPGAGRANPKDFALHTSHPCVGCPGCSGHASQGPVLTGSKNVIVDGFGMLRVAPEDGGTHDKGTCCGTNKWLCMPTKPVDRGVNVNGKLAFCVGDETQHCGKPGGKLMMGSTDVFVGDGK